MNTAVQSTEEREKLRARRLERLRTEDPQFRESFPLEAVAAAKRQPGLRLAQLVQIVMEGYSDRPALGQRARELVIDPPSGRRTLRLLHRFDTITYRELWARSRAIASAWHHDDTHPLEAGDFVCILGFTSTDYATLILACIHLGAVIVPLQTSAPATQHADSIGETQPRIVATSLDYLDAAVEALLAGTVPQRLVVFDYESQDDDQRDILVAALLRLSSAHCAIVIDTLDALTNLA
jgi:fatty acid CoA ligase FadD9